MPTPESHPAEPSLGDGFRRAVDDALRSGSLASVAELLHQADATLPGLGSVAELIALRCKIVRPTGRPSDPASSQAVATARAVAFKRHIREVARSIKREAGPNRQQASGRRIDVQTYFERHLGRRVDFGQGVAIDLYDADGCAATISELIGPAVDRRVIERGASGHARTILKADSEVRSKTSCLKTDFLDSRTEADATRCSPIVTDTEDGDR